MNLYEEDIRERLFAEVYNAAKMKDMLKEVVYECREDLVIVYRLSGFDEQFKRDCKLVTNEQLSYWGVDTETLKQDAWANTKAKFPPVLWELGTGGTVDRSINYLEMAGMLPKKDTSGCDMFVLTNGMNYVGAVYMFDEETMIKVAEKMGANLILLPSSVDDVIICSEEAGLNLRKVKDHIKAINKAVLMEKNILSWDIYHYDKDSHVLSIVQVPEHEKIPMPDDVSMEEMYAYGYTWDGMLPLSEEKALELLDGNLPVFRLYEDGSESMLDAKEEIFSHNGLFGVERETWMDYLKALNQKEQNEILEETTMVM